MAGVLYLNILDSFWYWIYLYERERKKILIETKEEIKTWLLCVDFTKIFFRLPKNSAWFACFCSKEQVAALCWCLRESLSSHTYCIQCALWAASSKLQLPKTCALSNTAHATPIIIIWWGLKKFVYYWIEFEYIYLSCIDEIRTCANRDTKWLI